MVTAVKQVVNFARLLKYMFSTRYCEQISDTLWQRRVAWTQEQCAGVPNNSKVLDVGAGTGIYRENFAHCEYYAQDFAKTPDLPYGSLDTISDIVALPFASNTFDVVICTEVFEHILYPFESLREIQRVLKPNGQLIFSAPLGSGHHQVPYHFYGGYTRFWYEKVFPDTGLRLDSIEPCGGLYGHIIELLWRGRYRIENKYAWQNWYLYRGIKQFFVYNVPTVILWEFEKQKLIEDFTVGFLVRATKVVGQKS
jgi:SAM-dependent methyltransferase